LSAGKVTIKLIADQQGRPGAQARMVAAIITFREIKGTISIIYG